MITIVDPAELQHVLRPTVYAPAVDRLPSLLASEPSEKGRIHDRSRDAESTSRDRKPTSP